MDELGDNFDDGIDADTEQTILYNSLYIPMENYFKKINVKTDMSYDENLLSEKAPYFNTTLIWKKVGKSYLESRASKNYDRDLFTLMLKTFKSVRQFAENMGKIELKTKIDYDKQYFKEPAKMKKSHSRY